MTAARNRCNQSRQRGTAEVVSFGAARPATTASCRHSSGLLIKRQRAEGSGILCPHHIVTSPISFPVPLRPISFLRAAPSYSTTDDRKGIQKAFDNLTTVTPEQQQGHGPVVNALQKFGAGAIQGAGQPFVHPVDTIEGLGHAFAHPIDTAHSMGEQFNADPAKAIGNVVGGAGLGMAAEAGLGKVIPPIAKSISERVRGYKSPVIPDEIQNARQSRNGNPSGWSVYRQGLKMI